MGYTFKRAVYLQVINSFIIVNQTDVYVMHILSISAKLIKFLLITLKCCLKVSG